MPEDDESPRETHVESLPGFDALTDHDKVELVKFEHYLRLKREPVQPVEGAYAHVYGEVVRDDSGACGTYLGDNDGTCPQLTCIRRKGHAGPCDNVRGD